MARCEDYPSCGHGGDPGGCPDFDRLNTCEDCGVKFHPDGGAERICYRCQAIHALEVEDDDRYR